VFIVGQADQPSPFIKDQWEVRFLSGAVVLVIGVSLAMACSVLVAPELSAARQLTGLEAARARRLDAWNERSLLGAND
jgi:hypothetical protein